MNESRILWSLNGLTFVLQPGGGGFVARVGSEPIVNVETPDELVFRMRDGGIECVLQCRCAEQSEFEQAKAVLREEDRKDRKMMLDVLSGRAGKSGPKE